MDVGFIFLIILTGVIVLGEIKKRNKKIEELEKDWKFCKSLLDDAREILTEDQKKQLRQKKMSKN